MDEIWYVETIGGHHWIARRVPDDKCAIIPNQLGIDYFDFDDAFSDAREFMCSDDLTEFIERHHRHRHREGPYLQHASRLVHVPPA